MVLAYPLWPTKLMDHIFLIYMLMICSCDLDATDMAASKKIRGQSWYARLPEHKKEEYRKKRLYRLQKKSEALNVDVPQTSIHYITPGKNTYVVNLQYHLIREIVLITCLSNSTVGISQASTSGSGPTIDDESDIDWLHINPTYQRRAAVAPIHMVEQEFLQPTTHISGRSLQMIGTLTNILHFH